MSSLEIKYRQDPEFRAIVDFLEDRIAQAEYSPTELRQACLLAAIHTESKAGNYPEFPVLVQ